MQLDHGAFKTIVHKEAFLVPGEPLLEAEDWRECPAGSSGPLAPAVPLMLCGLSQVQPLSVLMSSPAHKGI